jgi:hypothetical protein
MVSESSSRHSAKSPDTVMQTNTKNGGLNKDLTRHTKRHTSNMTDFAMEMQDAF